MKWRKSLILFALALSSFPLVASEQPTAAQVAQIIARLQRADFEGNQVALRKAFNDLAPFLQDDPLASRVHYWRGFAMWRRAINGFNDSVDQNELAEDLKLAVEEFQASAASDAKFVEAKIGLISCLGYQGFMHRNDPALMREMYGQTAPILKQVKELAPENPRFLWVLGPVLWNTPMERGGGQEKTIANYQKALDFARRTKSTECLEPTWGEPELLMSLAWSELNLNAPDLDAAERDARAALELVPYWHYVRDILVPQIAAARAKAKENKSQT